MLAATFAAGLALFAIAPFQASAALLTRELQFGMSGSDVSSLQAFLATDASVYPQGLVTGYFGSLTKAAVIKFQAKNGISTVGRVGPVTLNAINQQMGGVSTGYDVDAPVLSQVGISISGSAASLTWNTNENTNGVVYYSNSPLSVREDGLGANQIVSSGNAITANSDFRTSHSVTISGLSQNTTYYYMVLVSDASGNQTVSWPSSFNTTN